jgi:(2Fe-2S) ferredoxin
MAQPQKYVFVCLNQRPAGHPKGSCLDRGAGQVFEALREELGRRLMTNVKVVASGCVEGCLAGPTLLVVPDNVWYGGVTEADVPAIFDQHLVGGEPVEMLRLDPDDFNA